MTRLPAGQTLLACLLAAMALSLAGKARCDSSQSRWVLLSPPCSRIFECADEDDGHHWLTDLPVQVTGQAAGDERQPYRPPPPAPVPEAAPLPSVALGCRLGLLVNSSPFYIWRPAPILNYELWFTGPRFGRHQIWYELYGETSYAFGEVRETTDNIFTEEGDEPGDARSFSQEFGFNFAFSLVEPRSMVAGITPVIFVGSGIMVEWNKYEWKDSVRVGGSFIPRGTRQLSERRGALAINVGIAIYGNWWSLRLDTTSNLGSRAGLFEIAATVGVHFGLR